MPPCTLPSVPEPTNSGHTPAHTTSTHHRNTLLPTPDPSLARTGEWGISAFASARLSALLSALPHASTWLLQQGRLGASGPLEPSLPEPLPPKPVTVNWAEPLLEPWELVSPSLDRPLIPLLSLLPLLPLVSLLVLPVQVTTAVILIFPAALSRRGAIAAALSHASKLLRSGVRVLLLSSLFLMGAAAVGPLRESEEGKGEEAEGRGSSDSVDGGEGDEFMETGGLEILARWVGVRTAVSSENSQKQQWQCGVDGGEGDEFRETDDVMFLARSDLIASTGSADDGSTRLMASLAYSWPHKPQVGAWLRRLKERGRMEAKLKAKANAPEPYTETSVQWIHRQQHSAAGSDQGSCRLLRLNTYSLLLPSFSSSPPTSGSGVIVSSTQQLAGSDQGSCLLRRLSTLLPSGPPLPPTSGSGFILCSSTRGWFSPRLMSFDAPQHLSPPPPHLFFTPTHQRQWIHCQQRSMAGSHQRACGGWCSESDGKGAAGSLPGSRHANVVHGAVRVTLLLPDGRRFATQSTALHPSADLAMLKVTHRLHTKGPPASPLSSLQGVEEPAVARVKSELDVARVKSELAVARVKSELAVARVKSELAVARVKSELAVARVKSELAVARVKSELAVARVKSELAVARVKSELAVARVKSELAVARVKSELAVARVKSELAVAEEEGTGWSAADSVGSAKERATVHGCRGGGSREGVGEGLIKGEWDENSSVAVIFGEARGGEQERGGERGGKGDGEEGERQGDGGERGGGQRDGREEGAGNREEEWLPCAPIGDNDDVELADWVISVGNPVGLPGSISLGVISSLHRTAGQVSGSAPLLAALLRTSCAINPESFPPFSPSPHTLTPSSFLSIFRHPSHQVGVPHSSLHFFQTDCAINPGRSGSPLVNEF
ncbi:unnamed protein product [Closterium sp. NIES-65]|nr:unnamed protein product [Closterium sp. NIES-65]